MTFEHPYLLARRLSTLDHLTKGRVAWNVVSSYLNSAAVNVGMDKQMAHDERYAMADEYMNVIYKLWEGSWEEGAVKRDRENGVFTDATKVHPIKHEGKYFKVPGYHLCEPSPQRTPVIFQAGASGRGRQFAAANAEGMFVLTNTPEAAKPVTEDIRRRAVEAGRSADSIKIFTLLTVITGKDDAAAQAKFDEYLEYASPEGMLALYGGWTGIDFSQLDPDAPLEAVPNDSLRTTLESLVNAEDGSSWTVRDVIKHRCIGGLGPILVGGPETVADTLEQLGRPWWHRRIQSRVRDHAGNHDRLHRLCRSRARPAGKGADRLQAGYLPREADRNRGAVRRRLASCSEVARPFRRQGKRGFQDAPFALRGQSQGREARCRPRVGSG